MTDKNKHKREQVEPEVDDGEEVGDWCDQTPFSRFKVETVAAADHAQTQVESP